MQLETLGEKYGHTQGVEAGKREAAGGLLGATVAAVSGRASDTYTPQKIPISGI